MPKPLPFLFRTVIMPSSYALELLPSPRTESPLRLLVQEPHSKRLICDFLRVSDPIRERSERSPVGLGEGAVSWQNFHRAGGQKLRGRNQESGRRHGSLWS